MQKVEQAHEDTKHHLRAPMMMLIFILSEFETEAGFSAVPDGIHAKPVRTAKHQSGGISRRTRRIGGWIVGITRPLGGTAKQRHRDGETLVIQHTGVDAKHSHEQDGVSTVKTHLDNLVQGFSAELLLVHHEVQRRQEHEDTVSKVAEHDGEEERESDDGEHGGVHLTVSPHTIRLDDTLKPCDLLALKYVEASPWWPRVGRWCRPVPRSA